MAPTMPQFDFLPTWSICQRYATAVDDTLVSWGRKHQGKKSLKRLSFTVPSCNASKHYTHSEIRTSCWCYLVESWCRGYEAVGSLVCGLVKGKQPFQYVPHGSALRMLRHAMHMYFDQYDLQMDISNKTRPTFSIFTASPAVASLDVVDQQCRRGNPSR